MIRWGLCDRITLLGEGVKSARHFEPLYDLQARLESKLRNFWSLKPKESILVMVENQLVWLLKWGFYGHVKLPRERVKLARHFEPLYDLLARLEFELWHFWILNTKKSMLIEVKNQLVWLLKWCFCDRMMLPCERVELARHFEPLYNLLARLELELWNFWSLKTKKSISVEVKNQLVRVLKWGFYDHMTLPCEGVKLARHFEPLYHLLARLELELDMIFGRKFAPNPVFRGVSSNFDGAFFLYRVFIFLWVSSGSSTPNTAF